MTFDKYTKVKNSLCICHEGHSTEYLIQLRALRASFESAYSEITFTYGCREGYSMWFDKDPNVISCIQCRERKHDFGYLINLVYDAKKQIHPVLELVKDSPIKIKKYETKAPGNHFAYICPEGNYPTKSLNLEQINKLRFIVQSKGYKPIVVGTAINETDVKIDKRLGMEERQAAARSAGFVVGVECDMLYEAAVCGVPTALVPTGPGTGLYEMLVTNPGIIAI